MAKKKKIAKKKKTVRKTTKKKKAAKKKKTVRKTTKKKKAAKKKKTVRKTTKKKKAAKKKKTVRKTTKKKKAAKKKKTVRKTTKKKKRKANPAFMKPLVPSDALAAIVGSKPLPRPQVIKKMWAYIKSKGLQDSKDKRNINADASLKEIFGKSQISMFHMPKFLNEHLK